MAVDEWGEGPAVGGAEDQVAVFVEGLLDHEGVDVDEGGLEEVEAEDGDFLVFAAVGGDVTAFAVVDEPVRGVPVLNDVESFVDFASEFEAGEVVADEYGAAGFAEFAERPVGRVRDVGAGESAQDLFGISGPEPDRGCVADHLVVLLGDEIPVDRAVRGVAVLLGVSALSGGVGWVASRQIKSPTEVAARTFRSDR